MTSPETGSRFIFHRDTIEFKHVYTMVIGNLNKDIDAIEFMQV